MPGLQVLDHFSCHCFVADFAHFVPRILDRNRKHGATLVSNSFVAKFHDMRQQESQCEFRCAW